MKLWRMAIRNKATNVKTHLYVEAETNDQATRQITKMGLFGIDGAYEWLGTGPAHDKDGKRMIVEVV
jgi:hypothetical protein